MTDWELIEEHRRGNPQAFAELVRRHVDWVYSSAVRRVGDKHLAEDVTQAVFEVLSRKSPKAGVGGTLSLWLLGVVNLTCKQALRTEYRRRRRETEAAKMRSNVDQPQPNDWDEVAPHIDELVGRLNKKDRQAVLLRFFEQKSFAEIGTAIGISEEAARKRVSRATERIREMFVSKGITMPAIMLAGLLFLEISKPAPAALAAQIAAGAAGASGLLANGVVMLMTYAKVKIAALAMLVTVVIIGGGAMIVAIATQQEQVAAAPATASSPSTAPAAAGPQSGVTVDPPDENASFDALYRLEDGQILKHIKIPFVKGRRDFFRNNGAGPGRVLREDVNLPGTLSLGWDGTFHLHVVGAADIQPIDMVRSSLGIAPYDVEAPPEIRALRTAGDWVYRENASEEQKLVALSQIINAEFGKKLRVERQPTEQEVMVVTGKYALARLPQAENGNLHVYVEKLDPTDRLVRSDPLDRFLNTFANEMRMRFINQTDGDPPFRIKWEFHNSAHFSVMEKSSVEREVKLRKMFESITAQTGLKFTRNLQTFDVWHIVENK